MATACETAAASTSEQVVVWGPRDGRVAMPLIARHGLEVCEVGSVDELVARMSDAGCAAIATELLTADVRGTLIGALAAQPSWSDFPFVLFAPHGMDRSEEEVSDVQFLGNVSILERPIHGGALISTLLSALRGRRRQYDARDAIRRRDQFLAMLGHELRNPLAAMMLAIEATPALTADQPGSKQRGIIERQTRHLARLVDDLLDVARVTSGRVRLQTEPLELGEVVLRCVQGAELAARARGIELRAQLAPEPLVVDGDLVRLEEIFHNLISNALKYSPAGAQVVVTSRRRDQRCVVEVADTGIGLRPEMLDQVFELFSQAAPALDRRQGGLGIGLTLVRSLIELHHGAVTARSEGLGLGSTFVVELPLSRAPVVARVTTRPEVPQSQRVLLIDDNTDLLELTRDLLELVGCEVSCASDGGEGLERLLARQPDIAFIDIGLPTLDGYEIASQARARGVTAYLVAMTGYGQLGDQQRASAAGFDRHVTKPVTGSMLQEVLAVAAAQLSIS